MRQPLQAQRQVCPAPRLQHRVDLVHDDGANGAQHLPAPLGGQQQVQRLGSGDEDMRWVLEHRRPLAGRRVAGADRCGDSGRAEAHFLRQPPDLAARLRQVTVDVGAQGLERRDVEHPGLVREIPGEALAQEQIQLEEEGGESLTGAGGSGDQGMATGTDRIPAFALGSGRLTEPLGEPPGDDRMESRQGHTEIYAPFSASPDMPA